MNESNSIADNEINFINFLNSEPSGLRLFKGTDDFTNWLPKKVQNGVTVNDPCNSDPTGIE